MDNRECHDLNQPWTGPTDGQEGTSNRAGPNQTPPAPGNPNIAEIEGMMRNVLYEMMRNLIQQMQQTATINNDTPPTTASTANPVQIPPAQVPDQNERFSKALKTFLSLKPDTYDGTGEPIRISYWFDQMEEALGNVSCTEAEKVRLAVTQLRDGAKEWWKNSGFVGDPRVTWEMFKTKMQDRYFSKAMRKQKEKEFLYPKVEGLKVPELASKFNHLIQYATVGVSTEEQKIERFLDWLGPELQPAMVQIKCATLEQFIEACYRQEVCQDDAKEQLEKGGRTSSQKFKSGGLKRPASPGPSDKSSKVKTKPSPSQKSRKNRRVLVCYNCGEKGHMNKQCPKPLRNCHKCGKEGHIQKHCPWNWNSGQSRQTSIAQNLQAMPRNPNTV